MNNKKAIIPYSLGQEGAALVALIVLMLTLGLLGTAMYTMTSTSMIGTAQLNINQNAYYLAESGIRWMEAEYFDNPVNAEAVYKNITKNGSIDMGAANGGGTMEIEVHPYFGRCVNTASSSTTLVLDLPGTLDPDVFDYPVGGSQVETGTLWHSGGVLTFTNVKRVKNADNTDRLHFTINTNPNIPNDAAPVSFTAKVSGGEVILNDSDLTLASGYQFLPLTNGTIRTIAQINNPDKGEGYIKFHYKKRTGNKLEGISHYETEDGQKIVKATLKAGNPLVLLPFFHYVSTGRLGASEVKVDGYLYDAKNEGASEVVEYMDKGDSLDNWVQDNKGDKGSFETVTVDGDSALKVSSLDMHGDNVHEASMSLDWSRTSVNLKKSAEFFGGFLNYELQTKLKQDPGTSDNAYLVGLSFRTQKDGSQYGVSLFRPRSVEMPPPESIDMTGTLRDFSYTHPDMEVNPYKAEKNLVKTTLGADQKPVFNNARSPQSITVEGETSFDQWYNDVPGVNMTGQHTITLTKKPGTDTYYYDSNSFFIADNKLFGAEKGYDNNKHNFHFTYEIHSVFTYTGGEKFTFRGDDDVFVFIDDKLVIDLGGVHGPEEKTVSLDTLGLTKEKVYNFDFFFAERHQTGSNFRIETTIELINATDGLPGSMDKTGGSSSVWPHIPPNNGTTPQISDYSIRGDGWDSKTEEWLEKECNESGPDFFYNEGDNKDKPKDGQLYDTDCINNCWPICTGTKPTYYDVWNTNFDWDSRDINYEGFHTKANNTFLIIWQRKPKGTTYDYNWLSYRLLNESADFPEIASDGIIVDSTKGAIRDWSTLGVRVKEISRLWVTITNSTEYSKIKRGDFISLKKSSGGGGPDGPYAGGYCYDTPLTETSGHGKFLLTRVNRDSNAVIRPFTDTQTLYFKDTPVATIQDHHDQVNFIQAYVSRTDENGTPGPTEMIGIDKKRKGNPRGQVNWFPEDHEILDASNDYHRVIQWMEWNEKDATTDRHLYGDYDGMMVSAEDPWTRNDYNIDQIFARLATILTPSGTGLETFTPENNPEIGIHSYGAVSDTGVSSGIDMYFDDFAIRAEISIPELAGKIGTAQSR